MISSFKHTPVIVRILFISTGILIVSILAWWYATRPSSLNLTSDERLWLQTHKTIRIAPNPNFIPIEFYEGDTLYSGLAADLVREIERELGITFTIVRYNNMSEIFEAARKKEIDVITATAITQQRKEYLIFTDPFIHLQKVIVVRKSDPRKLTIDSLNGMKISIIYRSSVHERLLREGIQAILDTVPSTLESLYELSFGKVDASVANIATVSYIIERWGLSNLRIAGDFGPKDPYTMAIRNDWPEFASILNKALRAIPESKKNYLIKKWTGLSIEIPWYAKIPWQWIALSGVIFVSILTGVLTWNATLRRALQEKAKEVEAEFRKRLETHNALLRSEEKFEILFHAASDANLIIAQNRIVDCNDAASHILGWNKSSLIGKCIDEFSPPYQPDGIPSSRKYLELTQKALEQGSLKFEWVLQKRDGSSLWVEITLTRVTIENETVLYTTWRDITDRKVVEQETYNHYKQIQTLYQATRSITQSYSTNEVATKTITSLNTLFPEAHSCIWLLNPDTQNLELLASNSIQSVTSLKNDTNRKDCELCTWAIRNGKPVLINDTSIESTFSSLSCCSGSVLIVPLVATSHSIGCITVSDKRTHAFTDNDVNLLSTLSNSIAVMYENVKLIESLRKELEERKQIEEHRQKLEEEVRHMQKMESLGVLAGGIAHDFNNLLTIISAYTEMLILHRDREDQFPKYIEAIMTATKRATDLVRQILTFARRTELQIEPININEIILELTKLLKETFPKTIEIKTELDHHISPVLGDAIQIHQSLLNLAVNAKDAMPYGGSLVFKTELVPQTLVQNRFHKASASSYLAIHVQDSGVGIPQEHIERIFEPFFTTKEKGKGTGLGLSVVYGIIASMNGFIDVQSIVGKGTTFTIYLPSNHTAKKHERDSFQETTVRSGSETIFVIEDEDYLRSLTVSILEANGYRVLVARDGLEAVELYKQHHQTIDLILSDLGLPKLNGTECCMIMKRLTPQKKIIMTSGFFDPVEREKLNELGITHYLQKPYTPTHLLQFVREVLDAPPH
ncbi:MAG: transporter substrate-binding domain-containing protein [Bacteroidetes bacterium]|nr:transporter substrate-binding domain-containing protein [Bacteroidota bacterium]